MTDQTLAPVPAEAQRILNKRFGHDTEIALATAVDDLPSVRTVNAFYEDGSFYVLTSASSNKMRQIRKNPHVAVSGDWFTAHGTGEDLGPITAPRNQVLLEKLRNVFSAWYENGHINEKDGDTHILRIHLTDGVLMAHGTRYLLDFTAANDPR